MANKARAEVEISASDSKLAAGLARSRSTINAWASQVYRGVSKVMGASVSLPKKSEMMGGGFMSRAVGTFAGNMMTRGVDMVRDAAGEVVDYERALTRYQIVANKSPESMNGLRNAIGKVSRDTGLARDSILAGAQSYLDLTGDVEGTTKAVDTFGRVAQASDTAMADVSAAAAAMQDAMHVKPEQFEEAFSGLIAQGKAGAVTLRNMATEFPSVLSKMSRFGNLGVRGVMQVGAMFQVVRKGFGTAEEASTGLQAMLGGIIKHADRFENAGVHVFDIGKDGTKTLKPISAILNQIDGSVLAKDPQLLNKAFGRGEGEQAYQMLKGHVDMLREMERAGYDAGTVQRDLMAYTSSEVGRLDVAMNKIKLSIAEAFTPERIAGFANFLERAGGVVSRMMDRFDAFAKWVEASEAKTTDEKRGNLVKESADLAPKAMRAAADELDQTQAAFDDSDMMFSILNSPIFKYVGRLGGTNFDPSMFQTNGVYRSAANQLRIDAITKEHREAQARELNDPWNQSSGDVRRSILGKAFNAPVDFQDPMRATPPDAAAQQAFFRDLASTVGSAVRDGMAAVGVPRVQLGDDQVAKSVDGAKLTPRTKGPS